MKRETIDKAERRALASQRQHRYAKAQGAVAALEGVWARAKSGDLCVDEALEWLADEGASSGDPVVYQGKETTLEDLKNWTRCNVDEQSELPDLDDCRGMRLEFHGDRYNTDGEVMDSGRIDGTLADMVADRARYMLQDARHMKYRYWAAILHSQAKELMERAVQLTVEAEDDGMLSDQLHNLNHHAHAFLRGMDDWAPLPGD